MSGPLEGVRILDLTTVVMGPFATQLLGDLGAEVIKVEPPEGDNTRHLAPRRNPGMGAIFLHMNRNKRSIVLDLKKTGGHEALLKLARNADVCSINPSIIYVGAFGFDQRGPYAARPAYDDLIQGAVGFPSLMLRTGAAAPRYVPATVCDRIVGQATANAILAALLHRARTGVGQAVDVPMFETMAQFVLGDHFGGRTFVPPIGESGYPRVLARFRAPYATRDGYICALIYNDKQWKSFLTLIGKPELFAADARFNTHSNRAERIEEVYTFVAEEMRTRTTEEWSSLLTAGDIPWMPMNTLDELIDDPHLAAIGYFLQIAHPSEGAMQTPAVPTRWSASPPQVRQPAPRFGEHSAEVLREVGYSEADLERMAADGVTILDRPS